MRSVSKRLPAHVLCRLEPHRTSARIVNPPECRHVNAMSPPRSFSRPSARKQLQAGMPAARPLAEARYGTQLRAVCLQQSPAYALDHWGRHPTFALCSWPTSATKRLFTTLHGAHGLMVGRLAGPEWLSSLVSQQTARNRSAQPTRSVHDPRVSSTSMIPSAWRFFYLSSRRPGCWLRHCPDWTLRRRADSLRFPLSCRPRGSPVLGRLGQEDGRRAPSCQITSSRLRIGLSLFQYATLNCAACEGAARHSLRLLPSRPSPNLCDCYPTFSKSSINACWATAP
ncbi:hypothetical protein P171DRAFT_46142 [Karstenula rhodostoma CBS 690.94]|uniref:Uncharacterized protein n=1 Tax=Karstenula rhodostoma CBS 690.94 TaxID=1392251 RepID=A0A9P4PH53_9PLEO|nr:hypothetical protein P171DRAFT_46142 [Karstenula rhodostoma CBS 690.94]